MQSHFIYDMSKKIDLLLKFDDKNKVKLNQKELDSLNKVTSNIYQKL